MGHVFGWLFGSIIGIIVFTLIVLLYLLPTFIAATRHHRNFVAILLLNIFLGWSGVGWLATLIWAIVG